MSIRDESVVFDTNIWIFGLRRQPELPACFILLENLYQLRVVTPRQILRANLTEEEQRMLFRLLNCFPERVELRWEKAKSETVNKYRNMGCRLGDAVVAAHLEELGIGVLILENRHFLQEIENLPFRRLTAAEALQELMEIG